MSSGSVVAPESGLTLRELIAGIPHDAASIFGYVFIALFVLFIAIGLRRGAAVEPDERDS
jgi:hypothetical protein